MVGESQEAVGAGVGGGSSGTNKMPTLEEYGTNLTRQAEEVRGLVGWLLQLDHLHM
jgi:ATP-dependent Clp protease ATP-binding subunit ClpC